MLQGLKTASVELFFILSEISFLILDLKLDIISVPKCVV